MQETVNSKQKNGKSDFACPHHMDLPAEDESLFQVMLVREDFGKSVEVIESPVIDFNLVIENLNQGHSIFISRKRKSVSVSKSKKQKQTRVFVDHM